MASNDAFQALARLRALPAIAADARAAAALETLAGTLDPAAAAKSQRLSRAAKAVNSSLDLRTVLHRALDEAVEVMGAERGFILLRNRTPVVVLNNMKKSESDAPSQSIVRRVLETGEPIFTTDAQSDPRWKVQNSIVTLALRSIACVPLLVRDSPIGAVYLDSRVIPGLFTPWDREILTAFANDAAMSIENARLFEDERERAKRFSAMQAFQTRILEAIASGVITIAGNGTITTFNRAAEATFGVTAKRMTGRSHESLAKLLPEFPELYETFFSSGAVQLRAEVIGVRADSSELTLQIQFAPLESAEGLGAAVVLTDVTKQRELEDVVAADRVRAHHVQETFSRYLAPHVVKTLMNDPASVRMGGERIRATMLFADVRGFTAMAAHMPAERVVEILNSYFEEAVRVVFAHEGLLDKFYGDGMMAVFGPPLVRPDDAARALHAAVALQDVVAALRPKLDYPLQISVGLATGEVLAGNFGSSLRMDYTAIGDAVNLASGLEGAAPPGAVYCDEATLLAAGPGSFPAEALAVRIKGRAERIPAHVLRFKNGRTGG